MKLSEYQEQTKDTAIYPGQNEFWGLLYCSLGLASEAGEVAGKVKKMMRDGDPARELRNKVIEELGDTLWYAARVADELSINLEVVAHENLAKLQSRKQRGTLGGSGDDR